MSLYLHGLGHFHPANEIDNAFLEQLDIGTNDAWILGRVGIRSRRTVLPLDYIRQTRNADVRATAEAAVCSNAAMGERAARMAIARPTHSRRPRPATSPNGSGSRSVRSTSTRPAPASSSRSIYFR
jgi:3-oxoacyl-[acyl-carrier-protein] synthase III